MRKSLLASLLLACVGLSLCIPARAGEALPREYAKGASWQETMRTCRAAAQQTQAQWPVTLGVWYTTNPIRVSSLAEAAFPEQGVDINAKNPKDERVWNARLEYLDYATSGLSGPDNSVIYLYRTLTAAKDLSLPIALGGDSQGLQLWLNGQEVFRKEALATNPENIELALHAGENTLLVKVFHAQGAYSFYFASPADPSNLYWPKIEKDFPRESSWIKRDAPGSAGLAWFLRPDNTDAQMDMFARTLSETGTAAQPIQQAASALKDGRVPSDDPHWLDLYVRASVFRENLAKLRQVDFVALRLAIEDLDTAFSATYPKGKDFLARVDACKGRIPEIESALGRGEDAGVQELQQLLELQREALLANPLLDFDTLLLVKRGAGNLGLPQNWQGNCAMGQKGYDNEIDQLAYKEKGAVPKTFFRPQNGEFVGDVDLHFDAGKMLFSMPGTNDRWQIFEIGADGNGLRQVTPGTEPDVDNYDACYLPDERIVFGSTRCFQGVPCVGGSNTVANLCLMNADGSAIRQLCFDQDHDWCPTLLQNGRIMYTRWEYSDTPHYFSRLLFSMNPDGTNQAEYYGSNSYWPNSTFYARPVPGEPSMVAAIISGHHGVPRMGELILLDPAKGRTEGDGVVQRIPGYGKKVEPVIMDTLVDNVWPKFLHPYPLNKNYLLVSCKPTADAAWGVYLVDVFGNRQLLAEEPGYALFEPLPLRKSQRPPTIPDKVNLESKDATVYVSDVYAGPGLRDVPRGTVKSLRVYGFHYAYPNIGGHINVGVEGSWDVRRILGTVPVDEDGSASFKIPANTPVAIQPLDAQGRALQLMRSWFVGMPGEMVSCAGCHERQNMSPALGANVAARNAPKDIQPWYGPARGFSFKREVQPVLDKFCIGCHDGSPSADGGPKPDLRLRDDKTPGGFSTSYLELHPYVRRPGPESDYHILTPLEFHASTSELIQMLEKGHHGVQLDNEAWDRLYTWIDLNVPDKGSWLEAYGSIPKDFDKRRLAMRACYAASTEDPEQLPPPAAPVAFVQPQPEPERPKKSLDCPDWPINPKKAAENQKAAGAKTEDTLDLGNGVTLRLSLIPAGEYIMGSRFGANDEFPQTQVRIEKPFWMGVTEITNRQYQTFDPKHDNGVIDQHHKDHTRPGYSVQDPEMPAIRISWDEASAFCQWLATKTGRGFSLPSETQWEWACRAGAASPFYFGEADADFSPFANLADLSLKLLAVDGIDPQPIKNPSPFQDFLIKDTRFSDGEKIMTTVGKYQPNVWGLCDMLGNAAEWTRSAYRPYPYQEASNADGREKKSVRGGSWFDRPKHATASSRQAYEPWQHVYNVGFRVICPAE